MESNRLDVLGKRYKVTTKPPKSDPLIPDNYMGMCMDDIAHIYLNKDLREGEEYWTTLFHEMVHAVMYRNGIRFTGALPMELEEIIVETMAQAYYTTFKAMLKRLLDHGAYYPIREEILSFSKETR